MWRGTIAAACTTSPQPLQPQLVTAIIAVLRPPGCFACGVEWHVVLCNPMETVAFHFVPGLLQLAKHAPLAVSLARPQGIAAIHRHCLTAEPVPWTELVDDTDMVEDAESMTDDL